MHGDNYLYVDIEVKIVRSEGVIHEVLNKIKILIY